METCKECTRQQRNYATKSPDTDIVKDKDGKMLSKDDGKSAY